MGSNMAECHPVAFRWPLKAKSEHGAVLMHVDPRFTRTSALCDIHAPIRAGTDIVFLGAIINHVIHSERWKTDPFFREYVVNYTNAATLISPDFKDTEDLDGLYSGLSPDEARKFFFTPVPSLQEGILEAFSHLPPNPAVAIMPKASSTFVLPPTS